MLLVTFIWAEAINSLFQSTTVAVWGVGTVVKTYLEHTWLKNTSIALYRSFEIIPDKCFRPVASPAPLCFFLKKPDFFQVS